MANAPFDEAFLGVQGLVADFDSNKAFYLSAAYSEAEVRKDFIDKFLILFGWDVYHDKQKNPYEQEMKVERKEHGGSLRRADYAFYIAPNFRDVKFYIEAKKPFGDIATPDNCFQTVRYGWNSQTPIGVLFDFEQFQIIDCRYKPDIETATQRSLKKYHYSQYVNKETFAEIYWLFAREAVVNGSLETFADTLPKKTRGAVQRGLFKGGSQSIDESFLEELDAHRTTLAQIFKNNNPQLDGETLTEITQRTLDRLVFIRFLEDKLIEPQYLVAKFGEKGSAWGDFIAASRRLDGIYNGIVFKKNNVLDSPSLKMDDVQFAEICEELSHVNSPYDFNAIPIHILGSIYELFLSKVIVTTDKRAKVVEKPEVRKAGGVYYTPEYIVRYIVENSVGKLIENKTPAQIAEMRFADISCGSGSFLLGIYDLLIRHLTKYYNENPSKAKKGDVVAREDGLHLSLQKKREILLNNIYAADIDAQAVEVAQLSLYLKLLQDETPGTARQYLLDFEQQALLPSLNNNIVCGNSLVETDILNGELFDPTKERELNPMDFRQRFPAIFDRGGFDAVIGNPPYLLLQPQNTEPSLLSYLQSHYKVAQYKVDIFHLFIERAFQLINARGFVAYITPASFLTNNGTTKLREQILTKSKIDVMIVLPDGAFEEASVDNVVFVFQGEADEAKRNSNLFPFVLAEAQRDKFKTLQTLTGRQGEFRRHPGFMFRPEKTAGFTSIARKMALGSTKMGDLARVNFGMQLRDRKKYPEDVLENPSAARITAKHRECLGGSDVQVYRTRFSGLYCLFDRVAQSGGCWDEDIQFAKRKVLVRQIGKAPIASLETDGRCCLNALFMIKSLVAECDEAFLLGLINSRLFQVYWSNLYYDFKATFPKIKGTYLEELPIKKPVQGDSESKSRHDKMVSLVEQMITAKEHLALAQSDRDQDFYGNKCASLRRQIDVLVYDLYELTTDEIAAIESAK